MKKTITFKAIIITCLLAVSICVFGACGNRAIFDTKYIFDKAYITLGDETKLVYVKNWSDYENSDMIQVVTDDGLTYLTHSTNIVLIGD